MPKNFVKTLEYEDGLKAGRARAFAAVLNEENKITEKRIFHKAGKWSRYYVTFFGEPPLFVISYRHSTHPISGELIVEKYEQNEKAERIFEIRDDSDYYDPNAPPAELKPYDGKIRAWIMKFQRDLWERSKALGFVGE